MPIAFELLADDMFEIGVLLRVARVGKGRVIFLSLAHCFNRSLIYSGPLLQSKERGFLRHSMICSKALTTRSAGIKSTAEIPIACDSR